MTTDEPLLQALRTWAAEQGEPLAEEGITLHLEESRSGRNKPSMVLALDGRDMVSQLTVWDTGEAELEFGEIMTGSVVAEHRELASAADLHRALADLLRRQRGAAQAP